MFPYTAWTLNPLVPNNRPPLIKYSIAIVPSMSSHAASDGGAKSAETSGLQVVYSTADFLSWFRKPAMLSTPIGNMERLKGKIARNAAAE